MMKFLYFIVILATVTNADRYVRDIGLHLKGHHGADEHHHHHHHDEHSASESQQASARTASGYGRNIPTPPLTVGLTPENKPAVPETKSGYPRENPSNPLKIGQETRNVEVKIDQEIRQSQDGDDSSANSMGSAIPGEAGKDYPIYNSVPETSFKCEDQQWPGYYADEEARCQVFHICHDNRKFSFLCPNGTLFQQKVSVCDWWFNVDCSSSKDFFHLNALIGVVPPKSETPSTGLLPQPSEVAAVELEQNQLNLEYLPPPQTQPVENPPSSEYLPPPPVPAPTAAPIPIPTPAPTPPVVAATVAVETPSESYLPPENPPSSEYLPPPPPTAAVIEPLPVNYLPPVQPMPPTAVEALANGILTQPCDHSQEPVPNQSYLPPAL